MLDAALSYAAAGEPVFPLWWTDAEGECQCNRQGRACTPGKHPLTETRFRAATTDASTIRDWLRRWPAANLGARTDGRPRIDIDLSEVASGLSRESSLLYQTRVVRTPHDGLHIAFLVGEPVRSQVLYLKDGRRLGELKADGAYVVVPPSKIGHREYKLLSPPDTPLLATGPLDWLKQLLLEFGLWLDLERASRKKDYEALAGTIYEGEGRHNALTSYAGKAWVDGMDEETLAAVLEAVNQRRCRPPLQQAELRSIAEHFVRSRNPRRLVMASGDTPEAEETTRLAELVSRLKRGGSAILDAPNEAVALWGQGEEIIWIQGEPLMVYGPTGVGKTTLIQQLVLRSIGLGSAEVLGQPVARRRLWLYLALDRPAQIKRSFRRMVTEADRAKLDERLVIHDGPLGFDIGQEPEQLLALAKEVGSDAVAIDSLKDAAVGLEKPDVGQMVNRAHQLLVSNGIDLVINHHPRKSQVGNKKPRAIDDALGSRFIVDGCGSVLLIWGAPGDAVVELSHLKQPRDSVGPWTLIHDHDLGMTTLEEQIDAYTLIMTSNGISADSIARRLFRSDPPSKAQIENARRKARSVVKKGFAWEKPGEQGGKNGGTPGLFFKRDTVHEASTHRSNLDSESVHKGVHAPTDQAASTTSTPDAVPNSESVHESVHDVHTTTVHDSASLYREGGRGGEALQETRI
jgi:Bifunctional DNA primase/polymerase, N-terminal/AAA domain/Primase C terminal 1 (PriCT-1)